MRYAEEVMGIFRKIHRWCNRYEGLIVFVGLVILLRLPSLFTPHYYGDEEIYFVMGRAWKSGVPLYEAVFDHKPPLLYILAGIASSVFWFRLMLLSAMVLHTVLFFRLAKLFWAVRPTLAYVSTALFVLLTTIPTFEGNIANAELFMMVPVTASLLMIWPNLKKSRDGGKVPHHNWSRYLLAGLVAGVGWLFKIPVIFDVLGIAIFLFVFREEKWTQSLRALFNPSLWAYLIGFALPLTGTFAYYYLKGHGASYLETVLTVNLGYVSSWSTSEYAFNPFKSGMVSRAMIVAGLTAVLYALRHKLDQRFQLASIWLIFSTFGALLSGRPYPHYLHEPFVPLALWVPFIFAAETVAAWVVIGLVIAWAVLIQKQIKFWGYPTWTLYQNFVLAAAGKMSAPEYRDSFDGARRNYLIGDYLNKRMRTEDKLFIWGSDTAIYNITDKLPAGGKYMVNFHVHDFRKHDYVMDNLNKNQPKFVVVLPNTTEFPALDELLNAEYIETLSVEDARVYMRFAP